MRITVIKITLEMSHRVTLTAEGMSGGILKVTHQKSRQGCFDSLIRLCAVPKDGLVPSLPAMDQAG